jgi:hypothetical protein
MDVTEAVIGALLGFIGALILAFWAYRTEERRRRDDAAAAEERRREDARAAEQRRREDAAVAERRRHEDAELARTNLQNQYIVESSADLAQRVRSTLRDIKGAEGTHQVSWEALYDQLRGLDGDLQAQSPRYRLAGVSAASDEIRRLILEYLGTRASIQGALEADRELVKQVGEFPSDDAELDAEARTKRAIGFANEDLDRVIDEYKAKSYELLEARVDQVLQEVARYEPGPALAQSPLKLTPSREGFEEAHSVIDAWNARKADLARVARGG